MRSYTDRRVDISRLKGFALRQLPQGSQLRELMMSESDEMAAEELLVKMGIWLRLLDIELNKQRR